MVVLKLIHVTCAALSICGFFYRGLLKFYAPHRLQRRWLKVLPHVVDTVLLASAIAMLVQYKLNPFLQPWLLLKIGLLLIYIFLGLMTLRFSQTRRSGLISFVLAIAVFAWIVMIALTRQAWPFNVILTGITN